MARIGVGKTLHEKATYYFDVVSDYIKLRAKHVTRQSCLLT
jgi:hypothetical protein